jgi:hypothetical protein
MEFARKRGARQEAVELAATVRRCLRDVGPARNADVAYAVGTAYFLLGNLFRFGGCYHCAKEAISRARTFYRPAILAHQIELAHCQYASAVCRALEGTPADEAQSIIVAPEFRPFAEALLVLTRSHSAWSLGRLGEAVQHAELASQTFQQIHFTGYAKRAQRLKGLLEVWRRLELGARSDPAIAYAPEDAPMIRGMLGDPTALGTLRENISKIRPSQALGLLQFASKYNPDSTADIGEFELPPILRTSDGRLEWTSESARTLAEADAKLRSLMRIPPDVGVPLIAD